MTKFSRCQQEPVLCLSTLLFMSVAYDAYVMMEIQQEQLQGEGRASHGKSAGNIRCLYNFLLQNA